ncbi:MAG: mechanosensitive ion channel domain-containing protein [Pseudomonadota bacterium]
MPSISWSLRLRPLVGLLAVLVLCSVPLSNPAGAQTLLDQPTSTDETPELPSPLTGETVRDLVSTLSDQQVRALLLERLDAVAEEESEKAANDPSVLSLLETSALETVDSVTTAVLRVPEMPAGVWSGLTRFFEPRGWPGIGAILSVFALAILAGLAAELAVNHLARKRRDRIRNEVPDGLAATLSLLLRRAVLDVIGLIAFYLVAKEVILALLSSEPPVAASGARTFPDTVIVIAFLWWVVMLPRMMRTLTRFLMAPHVPALRLVHTDDWSARFIHRQLTIVFALWGLMSFAIPFLASHGAPVGQLRVGFWLNLAAFATLIYTIWTARPGLVMMMMGKEGDVSPFERRVALAYPGLSIVLVAATWMLIEALAAQRMWGATSSAILTMVVLIFTPTFDTAVRGLVKHLVRPMEGEGAVAEAAYLSTKRSYVRIGRVLISVGIILFFAWLWGLNLINLAAAGVGAQIAGRAVEVSMVLLAGFLTWELVSLWINRKLAAENTADLSTNAEEPGGGEGGGAGRSRLATVLPLVLGSLKAVIAIVFGLIALGHIGINITPLLAGAGVVGLAIGFGAQKLVSDVVSGIFFLIDDAFRVGEYVEVEGTRGTVEKISIRSMQLRHHLGPVHTIPFGEIPKLSNYSRDWVIMKLKFTVPFETDPNKVKKIFKQVGREMMEVPEYAEDLLEPFKSQGVYDIDDVGMVIRGKFMAKPGRQWVLRKEIYNRVKKALEENGIPFARREVRVAIPGLESPDALTDAQKTAVAEAAAQADQDGAKRAQVPAAE